MTQDEAWSFLNQLDHAPAKLRGRIRDVEKVDTIVIHRMGDLTAKNGVRYVQESQGLLACHGRCTDGSHLATPSGLPRGGALQVPRRHQPKKRGH